jgi:hypothetical protein
MNDVSLTHRERLISNQQEQSLELSAIRTTRRRFVGVCMSCLLATTCFGIYRQYENQDLLLPITLDIAELSGTSFGIIGLRESQHAAEHLIRTADVAIQAASPDL